MSKPSNHMAKRLQAKGSLDYFPTPPWATRAPLHELPIFRAARLQYKSARDPACGGGHMIGPLSEVFGRVDYSDVADWGIAPPLRDFTFETVESLVADGLEVPDWIITNPPYEIAYAFFQRAYAIANEGVALLLRLGWMAGQERYNTIFAHTPPTYICPFAERVAMIERAWDPEASTTTDYAWFIWVKPAPVDGFGTILRHFRPGMKETYTRMSDMALASPGEARRRAEARKAAQKAGAS